MVCGVPILPLATGSNTEGPCSVLKSSPEFKDIVGEAIELFRFTILLKNRFDIHSAADKVLVYLIIWIKRLLEITSQHSADIVSKEALMNRLVTRAKDDSLAVPGDENFSLSMFFIPPSSSRERTLCSKYLTQLRVETARRLSDKIWDSGSGSLSKWWLQYAEINWMGLSVN